ncbi:MAG: cyclodeaminase/cyclohydrolase family protein, partial [Paludibacter sp.]
AVKSMGLDELAPFDPKKKIIEYLMEGQVNNKLVDLTVKQFTLETASESAAPGGGSVSACMGAMGAALGTMVANLSAHKKGWEDRWEEFSKWAEKGKNYHDELVRLIDEDTLAFNGIMDAFGLSQKTENEKSIRKVAIQQATRHAMEIPFRVMQLSYESMEVMKAMAETGNPNSVSDAGVGALAARSAVLGAGLNVKINAGSLTDKEFVAQMLKQVNELEEKTRLLENQILKIVNQKIIGV